MNAKESIPGPLRRRSFAKSLLLASIVFIVASGVTVAVAATFFRPGLRGHLCGPAQISLKPATELPTEVPRQEVGTVFVVVFENTSANEIYASRETPFIGSLLARAAHATNYLDPLRGPALSEPHYIWMEAGTNRFADRTFCDDAAPSAKNSTSSRLHLTTQMQTASTPISWMSYQEGLSPSTTGACPINRSGKYAPKHDPFVFFQDVAGRVPSVSSEPCASHHRPLPALKADLDSGDLASYVFITPDLCHDMHDGCNDGVTRQRTGDAWLSEHGQAIFDWADRNKGLVFLVWDEASSPRAKKLPFIAYGPSVKRNYTGDETYTHSSLLRSIETIFGLTPLPTVAQSNDLRDLFSGGTLPRFSPQADRDVHG